MANILVVSPTSSEDAPTRLTSALTSLGHTVTSLSESALGSHTLTGDEIIFSPSMTNSVGLPWISARWAEGHPIVVDRSTSSTSGQFNREPSYNLGISSITTYTNAVNGGPASRNYIVSGSHPINGSLTGTVTLTSTSSTYLSTTRELPPYNTHPIGIVESSGSVAKGAFVSVIDEGWPLTATGTHRPGSMAPARAVHCGWLYRGTSDENYNSQAINMLGRMVTWLEGGDVADLYVTGTLDLNFVSDFSLSSVAQAQRNRYAGRTRTGIAVARWNPEVVPPPLNGPLSESEDVMPRALKRVRAFAYDTPELNGTNPKFEFEEKIDVDYRHRVVINGVDVTYFRGVETPSPEYQLMSPFLYGVSTLELPQVHPAFEKMGQGELKWLVPGASVKYQRVDPRNNQIVATDYIGVVVALNVSGDSLVLDIGGQVVGRAALQERQVPLIQRRFDIGRFLYSSFRRINVPMTPRLGTKTGLLSYRFGGMSLLDYMSQLVSMAVTDDGVIYTVMPNADGVYETVPKDLDTIHGTVYLDNAQVVADLKRDLSEEPNRIYASGISPRGMHIKFGRYPGLRKSEKAPYPMAGKAPFGKGTTDAMTVNGDGITVMVWRLVATGYLNADTSPGGYDDDAESAIRDLQRDAKLPVTGIMNNKTWNALFDLSATGYTLRKSYIGPAAEKTEVQQWIRSASGSLIRKNPNYNPRILKVDRTINMGNGFTKQTIRKWAKASLASGDNWVGTIRIQNGAIPAGIHTPGTPITNILRSKDIIPGMNLILPHFDGGIKVHVAGVSVDASGVVTLSVDTKARDTLAVWEVIQRNRESRQSPQRNWIREFRSSVNVKDSIITFDEIGGTIDDRIECEKEKWTVFPVIAGQAGTIANLRIETVSPTEFCVAVFGKRIGRSKLRQAVPKPLDKDGQERWNKASVKKRLRDDHFLLYVAGDNTQPCGYSPSSKEDGGPLTGVHEDDAGFGYWSFIDKDLGAGVLWVAIWPKEKTKIRKGRIMWPQAEAGL